MNCESRHAVRILVSRRGCEQSNFKDGTFLSLLAILYLEPRASSGGVVEAGLELDRHKEGTVAFDEIILKADSPGLGFLNFLEKNKKLQLFQFRTEL